MTAVEIVDAEVRELVRRRGVDPMREPATVRRLVDEVLADYADRALAGALPVVADPAATARAVFDSVAGLGPLQRYLDDPDVEEIWINGPGRVFVARRGRSELTTAILSAEQIRELVERMLKHTGRRVDLSVPFVDATLPDGSRLHVVIPDITPRHWAVNIRKFVVRAQSLDELVGFGSITPHAVRFLEAAVAAGLNIVVSGGTQAGKTTLLNCLAAAIPASDRVISCEEVFELRIALPDWVAMQTRQANLEGNGEIPLRRLVTEALRMRPSRLIVGEVRQAECLDLLIALNSGVPGMASVHANSARQAITKLCTLPLLAGENINASFIVPTVATSIDLVVHTDTDGSGLRRVREIVAVPGRTEESVIETADVFTSRGRRLVRADGYPPHPERFERAGYDLSALLAVDERLLAAVPAPGRAATPPPSRPPALNAPAPRPPALNAPASRPAALNAPAPRPAALNAPAPRPAAVNAPAPRPAALNVPAHPPANVVPGRWPRSGSTVYTAEVSGPYGAHAAEPVRPGAPHPEETRQGPLHRSEPASWPPDGSSPVAPVQPDCLPVGQVQPAPSTAHVIPTTQVASTAQATAGVRADDACRGIAVYPSGITTPGRPARLPGRGERRSRPSDTTSSDGPAPHSIESRPSERAEER